MKECILYDRPCKDCGECDRCDLDPSKTCDNCGKCMETGSDYNQLLADFVDEGPRSASPTKAKPTAQGPWKGRRGKKPRE